MATSSLRSRAPRKRSPGRPRRILAPKAVVYLKAPRPDGPSRLKLARIASGYTQVVLARKVGVGPAQLNGLERGKCVPTAPLAARLAQVLRVHVSTLFPPGQIGGRHAEAERVAAHEG